VSLLPDFTVDIEGMRKAIDSNTICVAGSAPDYAFGLFDDIPTIGALAL
jgi:glutamate/tyrosine decarboxylase-like PLP-dependent enzyme